LGEASELARSTLDLVAVQSVTQHNEFHDLYALPSIISITKSWKMRWAGHVARLGALNAYKF